MRSPLPLDSIDLTVPSGTTAIVVSDLHLRSAPTMATAQVEDALVRRLDALSAPAVVVLAGDIVEFLGEPTIRARDAFAAHPRLSEAIHRIANLDGCSVIELVGNHDAKLAWDPESAAEATTATGATLALTLDLLTRTSAGCQRIRIEHGNRFDPYNRFEDVRNPLDTPFGHHVVREVLPFVNEVAPDWLDGTTDLADPPDFPSFVGSRLAYRRLAGHLRWLLIPLVLLMVLLRVPLVLLVTNRLPDTLRDWLGRMAFVGGVLLVDVLIIVLIVIILIRRSWRALRSLDLSDRGWGQNKAAREGAADLAASGYAGLICGHSHRPEISGLPGGDCFFANSGSATPVVEAVPARFGMPPVYLRYLQISWLELRCGDDLRVDLAIAETPLPGATRLERYLAKRHPQHHSTPAKVASWPGGRWPT